MNPDPLYLERSTHMLDVYEGKARCDGCAGHVHCEEACGALVTLPSVEDVEGFADGHPDALEAFLAAAHEAVKAATHWRDHHDLGGCSHGR